MNSCKPPPFEPQSNEVRIDEEEAKDIVEFALREIDELGYHILSPNVHKSANEFIFRSRISKLTEPNRSGTFILWGTEKEGYQEYVRFGPDPA
jgi:hypothetical protein